MAHVINIAFYRKEDWQHFVETADDRDKLQDCWEDWFLSFIELRSNLEKQFEVHEVIVNIDELLEHCRKNKLKNTAATRSEYVRTR